MLSTVQNCRSCVWRDGAEVARDFPLDELDHWLADEANLVWLDLVAPDAGRLSELATELDLDPLAVEDAVEPRERPKASRHQSHTFVTCYSTSLTGGDAEVAELTLGRVSAFIMKNALITVRQDDLVDMDVILARWNEDGLLGHGVAALVHGMLDELVDGYFDTIERLDEILEGLEDLLFDPTIKTRTVQQRIFAIRKALVQLRRVVLPMREVVTSVMRFRAERGNALSSELDGNFNDLYDHVIRAAEWTESLRDMVSSIFETNLSLQDARLNEIMKKLAAWAAIIAVPTAVTGWFGQNVPYPGFNEVTGVIASVVAIVLGSVGLYIVFKRFDWL